MGMIKEFKEFAMKGNVVDMAVGVIIGGAFGKIVSSLVGDVFMPAIGAVAGQIDFSGLAYTVVNPIDKKPVSIAYGKTLTEIVNFVIVAFCLFMVIKLMNSAKKQEAAAPAAPPAPTKDQELLSEIRDLLKKRA